MTLIPFFDEKKTHFTFKLEPHFQTAPTITHNVGGMKSCRLRAISYPVTQKLKRATTLE
jgi:hypothetical protein